MYVHIYYNHIDKKWKGQGINNIVWRPVTWGTFVTSLLLFTSDITSNRVHWLMYL